MKHIVQNILLSVCIIFAVAAGVLALSMFLGVFQKEPVISIVAEVRSLSDKEYEEVGTKDVENPTKEDFKKFVFRLDVQHSRYVKNRHITVPIMQKPINSYDGRQRYWYGSSSEQDNRGEKFARYGEEFVFYARGMDNEAIKNLYKSQEVIVSWKGKEGKTEVRKFTVSDILEFK